MYARLQLSRSTQSIISCLRRHYFAREPRLGLTNAVHRSIKHHYEPCPSARYKHDDNIGDRKLNVLNMTSSQYLDYMYKAWLRDPQSVSSSWDSYFKLIHTGNPSTKDSRARSSSARVSSSSSSKLNLNGMQSSESECALTNRGSIHRHARGSDIKYTFHRSHPWCIN